MKIIDVTFMVSSDSHPRDPDKYSPTLRRYHKILWSKRLPNGKLFDLRDDKAGVYLYHKSELGEFFLGSDAISHSYQNQKSKKWLTQQVPDVVKAVYTAGCTIGAYIIFPNNRVNGKQTINGARGCIRKIDDRFDLTLECIRRFYLGIGSPLFGVLSRYHSFFDLFVDFQGYVDFFLLQDLVSDKYEQIKFYLPFDNFDSQAHFRDVNDYYVYKERVLDIINRRNERIDEIYNNKYPTSARLDSN